MQLPEFLTWIVSGGGAALVAYWMMERVPFLVELESQQKRFASLALAAVIACAGFVVSVAAGYREAPASEFWPWLEALFSVIAVAIGGSQGVHGLLKLGERATE